MGILDDVQQRGVILDGMDNQLIDNVNQTGNQWDIAIGALDCIRGGDNVSEEIKQEALAIVRDMGNQEKAHLIEEANINKGERLENANNANRGAGMFNEQGNTYASGITELYGRPLEEASVKSNEEAANLEREGVRNQQAGEEIIKQTISGTSRMGH